MNSAVRNSLTHQHQPDVTMNESVNQEGSREEFVNLLGELGEEPAFVRRAIAPKVAMSALFKRCENQRAEWLRWPRHHFTAIRTRTACNWDGIRPFVNENFTRGDFETLVRELAPLTMTSRSWLASTRSLVRAFSNSAARFNRNWQTFLDSDILANVNRLRDEYNRYYHIEKACAFGFESEITRSHKLPLLNVSYLLQSFPLLPVP